MQAITQGKVPAFPPQSKDEPSTIRGMLEEIYRRCWTDDPALHPTMYEVVGDLKRQNASDRRDNWTDSHDELDET